MPRDINLRKGGEAEGGYPSKIEDLLAPERTRGNYSPPSARGHTHNGAAERRSRRAGRQTDRQTEKRTA